MDSLNRRDFALALGGTVLAGLAGLALAPNAMAIEHDDRWYREHHPKIHAAIMALKEAREEVDKAGHDYGGHKKEAIESIDRSIRQLESIREFER